MPDTESHPSHLWPTRFRQRLLGISAVILLASVVFSGCGKKAIPTAPIHYTIADLGTLPGDVRSYAKAINDRGEVVGMSEVVGVPSGSSVGHAFVYHDGRMTDLGTLGGRFTRATGINADGQIVGVGDTASRLQKAMVFHIGRSRPVALGTLSAGESGAMAINAHGQIIGNARTVTGAYHAVRFHLGSTTVTDLGALPGDTFCDAMAINDSGQIVGESETESSGHAFVYQGGKMTDLGLLRFDTESAALGINASGQIIGVSNGRRLSLSSTRLTATGHLVGGWMTESHAVLFHLGSTSPTSLGTLPGDTESTALGINDPGQIVGYSSTSSGVSHAALFQRGSTTPIALETGLAASDQREWQLEQATAINNSGRICGIGIIHGQTHAFLMMPLTTR